LIRNLFRSSTSKKILKTLVTVSGSLTLPFVDYSGTVDLGRLPRRVAERSIRPPEARKAVAFQARLGVAIPWTLR